MEVVLRENLADFIDKVATAVCRGQALAAARVLEHGVSVMPPESIQFSLIVIEKFQDEALQILANETSETVSEEGGTAKETTMGGGTMNRTTESSQYRDGATAYNQTESGNSTYN